MKELNFDLDWLPASVGEPLERETLARLRISVGPKGIPVTEVEDTIAQTVRQHINVPAYDLARWLIVNWWRLRWEPLRTNQSSDWVSSHCLAAVGGDYAWPALTLSSDGEFIHFALQPEEAPDVSAVRYLRRIAVDIPAADFEAAVEEYLDTVEARLSLLAPEERELGELRRELRGERSDGSQAMFCKLQALFGFDPGSASEDWLRAATGLVGTAGPGAAQELLAIAPDLPKGLTDVDQAISAMRLSNTTLELGWAELTDTRPGGTELPWERGARMASELRAKLGLPDGPLQDRDLAGLLDVEFPLPSTAWHGSRLLRGGFRNGVTKGRTAVIVTSPREDSQRFYAARLAGAALNATDQEHVLPVSDAATALQKFERSFAQEFLCPWRDLDAFTDEKGTDDDAIAEAAEHFIVSERVIVYTLVNKGKIARSRLQPC